MESPADRITSLARSRGVIRARDVEAAGVHRKHLRRLVESGELEQVGRGMYRLADALPSEYASLAEVVTQVPRGVVCLLSALAYNELTTQSPYQIWIAIAPKAWAPTISSTKLRVVRMSDPWLDDGVDVVEIDGARVRITDPARTVVDCFRFRNTVGLDVAIEALRDCLEQRLASPAQLMDLARRRRVGSVMRPYLEALTA
jgi:predicted transcriptional regulator of viral defense system